MTTPAEVIKLIEDNDVKFVDLRITDTLGKEQHLTVPASHVTEALLKTVNPLTVPR